MAIINLRRYYPHYPKDKFIDVSDEVAAALDEGKRIERRQDKKRTYSIVSLLLLQRRLIGAVSLEGEAGVWLADHIDTPFVLGLFRPKIYIPSDLPDQELDYILLHERTHICRFDYIFRILAWLVLTIHWFNPMVWLAFYLAGKDVEMSCDEAVLRHMKRDVRVEYSSSLLRLSTGKWLQAGPLAFGSGNPQGRIKNVLNYKKPALLKESMCMKK